MVYLMVPFPMTLSDLWGHSSIASLFKCDFCHSCTTFDKISTDRASRGPSAIAELTGSQHVSYQLPASVIL